MNAEEYFSKEFKKYVDYKQALLNNADYMQDSRVSTILRTLPTAQAMATDTALRNQLSYLQGRDLVGEKPTFTQFLNSALPITMPRVGSKYIQYCGIKGIEEPYFDKLNKTMVKLQDRDIYTKRLLDSESNFILDPDGVALTKQVPIPQESRVVFSHTNIHLCNYKTLENGRRVRSSPSEGFGYIDYVDSPEGRGYLYYIPRKYIYPLNLNVLVFSQSRLTVNYYWGRKYLFNRGISSAYLYIAPYKQNVLKPQNLVFCLKASDDFSAEIQSLESYWQSCINTNGMPQPSIFYPFDKTSVYDLSCCDSETGDTNLAYTTLPVPEREPYIKCSKSLEELKNSSSEDDF